MRRLVSSFLTLVFALGLGAPAVEAQDGLVFGVLAKRGEDRALEQWGPLAEYLGAQLGRTVSLKPLAFEAV